MVRMKDATAIYIIRQCVIKNGFAGVCVPFLEDGIAAEGASHPLSRKAGGRRIVKNASRRGMIGKNYKANEKNTHKTDQNQRKRFKRQRGGQSIGNQERRDNTQDESRHIQNEYISAQNRCVSIIKDRDEQGS